MWAEKIVLLRRELSITQVQLAQRLGVKQPSVSAWEGGSIRPSPTNFIALSELTHQQDLKDYFQAAAMSSLGFDKRVQVETVVMGIQRRQAARVGATGMVFIPLLKDSAAAGQPRALDEKNIEAQLEIPAWMCPKPDHCVAIKVTGDSMSPILEEGYIVLVDVKQKDPKKLVNEMVAARDAEGGVTFKWLRKMKNLYVLMPNHTSLRHQPVVIDSDDDYAIVGRIVHFIGQPPRPRGKK